MAYRRTHWKDHAVKRPRTYTMATNSDRSVTLTPAPEEIMQKGTPQSATNFNNIEEGLQHTSVAFDWLYCIMQAQAREITTLKEQVATLSTQ